MRGKRRGPLLSYSSRVYLLNEFNTKNQINRVSDLTGGIPLNAIMGGITTTVCCVLYVLFDIYIYIYIYIYISVYTLQYF